MCPESYYPPRIILQAVHCNLPQSRRAERSFADKFLKSLLLQSCINLRWLEPEEQRGKLVLKQSSCGSFSAPASLKHRHFKTVTIRN